MKRFRIRHKILSALTNINIIGLRAIVNQLPKIIIPKPVGKMIIETLHGFVLEIDPVTDVGVERSIYYTGTYEKGTLYVIQNVLKKGDVFVDVGANIGLMSIFASLIVEDEGKVFSFEPNPATYNILMKNIDLNNISNIETSKYGLGSKAGTTEIYDVWDSGRGSATMIKPEEIKESGHTVNIVSLTEHFKNIQSKINFIKFDIEGYEFEALKGAKNIIVEMLPMLIIEISDINASLDNVNGNEVFNFIKEIKNYRIFKLNGSKKRNSKLLEVVMLSEMPIHDNIFCFTDEHIQGIPSKIFKN